MLRKLHPLHYRLWRRRLMGSHLWGRGRCQMVIISGRRAVVGGRDGVWRSLCDLGFGRCVLTRSRWAELSVLLVLLRGVVRVDPGV
jgi:hypothetical protein